MERWSGLSRTIVFGSYADLHGAEFGEFLDDAEHALAEIDDDGMKRLLSADAWEPRIVGAWIAGVKKRREFLPTIAGLLLSNGFPFVSHGYCFALARFADDAASDALVRYLDDALPRREIEYDQVWAMAALAHVDAARGTSRSEAFLEPGGAWARFMAQREGRPGYDLAKTRGLLEAMIAYVDKRLMKP